MVAKKEKSLETPKGVFLGQYDEKVEFKSFMTFLIFVLILYNVALFLDDITSK